MKLQFFLATICLGAGILILPQPAFSQDLKPIKLPAPQIQGGMPLMQALAQRRSLREYSSKELSSQMLSDLLWAACGINRSDSGGRTAPTAMNKQEIDVYVAKSDGLYLYDAKQNTLVPVISEDLRALTGKQDFVATAALNLVYVADFSKMSGEPSDKEFYSAVDTGYISENVYLYCASAGLATVARNWVDKPALAAAMKLKSNQKIILTQTVGYPK